MAPPLSALYTLSFFLALLTTLLVASSLRLLAILPRPLPQSPRAPTPPTRSKHPTLHVRPARARVLVVLGSGGHTHEMLALLRHLDTRRYVHRTYVVSSGDTFSAQRAVAFEAELEERARQAGGGGGAAAAAAAAADAPRRGVKGASSSEEEEKEKKDEGEQHLQENEKHRVGPAHYTISTIPRARRIHQPLYSTPFTALRSLLAAFHPLLSVPSPPSHGPDPSTAPLPHLVITNGPATAVLVILAALVLRFFNVRRAHSRRLCRTIYVESFARVNTLSLSGRLVVRLVDRFLVQWESLEGYAGRAEYGGILV
ncbi:hypothetical protein SVAN01_07267 [Stagonosporopsis vannaccii]|nr:hypothetical protein SVAN01_07267 [Stagonosporopsis vannaccii]